MVEGDTKKNNNRGLVVILCVLVVLIVGLAIGVAVVKMHENSEDMARQVYEMAQAEEGKHAEETAALNKMDGIFTQGKKILDSGAPDAYTTAMAYFDEQAEMDDVDKNTVEMMRVDVLLEYDKYYNEAIQYLDKINLSELTLGGQGLLYAFYSAAYQGIGDTIKADEYKAMHEEVIEKLREEDANE